jgi:tetratricopeptide (TPR) repeat protein
MALAKMQYSPQDEDKVVHWVKDKQMFPDENRTYPGRKFIQALQVCLVIAIGAFSLIALTRSPSPEPAPMPTPRPIIIEEATPAPSTSDRVEALYEQAWEAHDVKNYDEAIDLYTQVLELDSTIANAWLGRAVAYAQTGEGARSRNDFGRYVQNMETERLDREITADETLTLDMVEGRVYAVPITLKTGETLGVTAKSVEKGDAGDPEVVDPLVLVFDPMGNLVEADDDTLRANGSVINMDSQIKDYEVTRSGTYLLLITHAGGGSEGAMDVTANVR